MMGLLEVGEVIFLDALLIYLFLTIPSPILKGDTSWIISFLPVKNIFKS